MNEDEEGDLRTIHFSIGEDYERFFVLGSI